MRLMRCCNDFKYLDTDNYFTKRWHLQYYAEVVTKKDYINFDKFISILFEDTLTYVCFNEKGLRLMYKFYSEDIEIFKRLKSHIRVCPGVFDDSLILYIRNIKDLHPKYERMVDAHFTMLCEFFENINGNLDLLKTLIYKDDIIWFKAIKNNIQKITVNTYYPLINMMYGSLLRNQHAGTLILRNYISNISHVDVLKDLVFL